MKKLIFILLIFTVPLVAQQLNHTWGTNLAGETLIEIAHFDTTAAETNEIYVDLNDWYPGFDINPLVNDDSAVVALNSDRMYLGTLYAGFDNWGTGSPTTDSLVNITINVAPGIYTSSAKSLAEVDWGTAVTLETIEVAGDYFAVNNVYIHATKYKTFPPEVIVFTINPPATTEPGCDDSTSVAWDFVYPAMYHQEAIQKPADR